jgi:hypothetical protein
LLELVQFRLVGRWHVGGQVWETISGQLKEWVQAMLAPKSLEITHTTLQADDVELLAQGLVPVPVPYGDGDDPYEDTETTSAVLLSWPRLTIPR